MLHSSYPIIIYFNVLKHFPITFCSQQLDFFLIFFSEFCTISISLLLCQTAGVEEVVYSRTVFIQLIL